MARIRWDDLEPATYEDMVAVLLSHLYPQSQRIDGRSGDGGRDVRIPRADGGEDAFELKSFVGRMDSSRRQQVANSLKRAKTNNPSSWTLVVPIDPNPDEVAWFARLQKTVSFPITWQGRTWLDAQFATRQYIARYFIEGRDNEVVQLLKELREEQAALAGGIPDAIRRATLLVQRSNELDPFFRIELTSDGETTSVRIAPRYAGAEADSPIRLSMTFAFPDTDEGRAQMDALKLAIDWGEPFRVDATNVHLVEGSLPLGLDAVLGTDSKPTIQSGPARQSEPLVIGAMLMVMRDDRVVEGLPVSLTHQSSGLRGAVFSGGDRSGLVTVSLRFDAESFRGNVSVTPSIPDQVFPGEALPAFRFMSAVGEGAELGLAGADGKLMAPPGPMTGLPLAEPGHVALFNDILAIQAVSGLHHSVSVDIGPEEAEAIAMAAVLARGGSVSGSWSGSTATLAEGTEVATLSQQLADAGEVAIVTHEPFVVVIQGHEHRLGTGVQSTMASVRISDDSLVAVDSDAVRTVRLVPGDSDKTTMRLVGLPLRDR